MGAVVFFPSTRTSFTPLKPGVWGLWQFTHRKYVFAPSHWPTRLPCTPARQSRYLSPWHWPQSRYDSVKGTGSPLASFSTSRFCASWQSRHQRCSES